MGKKLASALYKENIIKAEAPQENESGFWSRVEGTKSRVESNMSRVEGAKSRVLRK